MGDSNGVPRGNLIISSSLDGPFRKIKCPDCDGVVIVGKSNRYCPFCYAQVRGGKQVSEVSVTASLEEGVKRLSCGSCGCAIYSNSMKSAEQLANTIYCVVCGSSSVEVDRQTMWAEEGEGNKKAIPEEIPDEEENEDNVEEGQEDKENSQEESDIESFEAALLANPESWIIFKNGSPILRILKSSTPADAHVIFSSPDFIKVFKQEAKEKSLASAINSFNAEIMDEREVIRYLDIKSMAFDQLRASAIPKFQGCLALALEGASKGIYPDVYSELKGAFFDELVSRGMEDRDATAAIEASFTSSGSDVFSALIAKATELMYKPKKEFVAIKATIQTAGVVPNANLSGDDLERKLFRERLKEGNIPIATREGILTASSSSALAASTINSLRARISLGRG